MKLLLLDFWEVRWESLGLEVGRGEFLDQRENVWGTHSGAQSGPNLLFVGHTDVVHVRGWEEHWQDDERANPFGAAIVDGHIWGRGACDLKGGICTALAAYRLLQKAGLRAFWKGIICFHR